MLFAACAPKYPTVTPDEFEQAIAEPDVQLVDVRTPEEYEQGHIVGAMNIDWKSPGATTRYGCSNQTL